MEASQVIADASWSEEHNAFKLDVPALFKTSGSSPISARFIPRFLSKDMGWYLRHRHDVNLVDSQPLAHYHNAALFVTSKGTLASEAFIGAAFRCFGRKYCRVSSWGPHICR